LGGAAGSLILSPLAITASRNEFDITPNWRRALQ
jgi:hypothetical protein